MGTCFAAEGELFHSSVVRIIAQVRRRSAQPGSSLPKTLRFWLEALKWGLTFDSASEHLEAEDLIGTFGTERIFACFQTVAHFDPVEFVGDAIQLDTDRFGLLLGAEQDFPMTVSDLESVKPQSIGIQFIGLEQKDRRCQRRLRCR